jgi:altronate dehydratase small subunit
MSLALAIHPADNVATALDNFSPGDVEILGESPDHKSIVAVEHISRGHKIALQSLAAGDPVVKFGVVIGNATASIPAGAWVHTHNCGSRFDARSSTLDRHTGAPTDTKYE